VAPGKPVSRPVADPPAPEIAKPAAGQPTYQVFMPPLRYDSSAKYRRADPKLIVMVRRCVRHTLIFQSRVEGDALPHLIER
jgi:hypothetical protein